MITRTFAAASLALLFAFARPAAAQQPAADEALLTAVSNNDVAAAEAALRAGANPRMTNENGSVLAMAALFGSADVVRVLLEHGADPAAPGPNGGNALNTAFFAMNGMALLGRDDTGPVRRAAALEVVRLIAARRVGLDNAVRMGPTNVTPLIQAAEAGALDVVRILLDAGANPNAPNAGGYTPLDYAVDRAPIWSIFPASDRVEIVRLLLARGARTQRAGADRVTPLERARRTGNAQIVALLQGAAR